MVVNVNGGEQAVSENKLQVFSPDSIFSLIHRKMLHTEFPTEGAEVRGLEAGWDHSAHLFLMFLLFLTNRQQYINYVPANIQRALNLK